MINFSTGENVHFYRYFDVQIPTPEILPVSKEKIMIFITIFR